jgi:hypothetical protein
MITSRTPWRLAVHFGYRISLTGGVSRRTHTQSTLLSSMWLATYSLLYHIVLGWRPVFPLGEMLSPEDSLKHQQNVNRSGSHNETSQTLRWTSPVLPSDCSCSQAPRELIKVLSDSERAFSGAPESTCSYGGEFKMLRDLTYRMVKF